MNHYDTLGVAQDATPAQIKAAYRKLASKTHPDRAQMGNEEDRKKREAGMKRINAAYATLGDAKKRARYDSGMGKRQSTGGPRTRKERAKAAPKTPPKDQHFDFNKISVTHLCGGCNGMGMVIIASGMTNQKIRCFKCYGSGINLLFADLYSTV